MAECAPVPLWRAFENLALGSSSSTTGSRLTAQKAQAAARREGSAAKSGLLFSLFRRQAAVCHANPSQSCGTIDPCKPYCYSRHIAKRYDIPATTASAPYTPPPSPAFPQHTQSQPRRQYSRRISNQQHVASLRILHTPSQEAPLLGFVLVSSRTLFFSLEVVARNDTTCNRASSVSGMDPAMKHRRSSQCAP
ncbi:uncharacterized protein PAN0_003d1674 [Moesziomyces antarcticus]|uniref:Uncharacterized protein n=1 Tax=Pseudozyma antarctica TaxID=84753 RepID=A0A5C3FI47_PSEA2|nr:uncharacterized protein PAN0_003d1674 [Moesziomyces antarcticus]GAK63469.1 hypothetical protein PAN0_003d1674 [Moesziomyces antarcticus]SPO44058.1 uncharacterized protein PSANT_01743 [Moesziomyces antarcticus]